MATIKKSKFPGTVREISLSPTALILDDAMSNGQVLPDGYVV